MLTLILTCSHSQSHIFYADQVVDLDKKFFLKSDIMVSLAHASERNCSEREREHVGVVDDFNCLYGAAAAAAHGAFGKGEQCTSL